jgi:HEAT repeat protein
MALMVELEAFIQALSSGDDSRAEPAARQIAAQGEAALPALQPLLTHPNADTRWWAVRTLADLHGVDVVPYLMQALADSEPGIRQCAARGLQERPDERALPGLIAALQDDDSLVVRIAANALVAAGEMAVPALLQAAQDGSQKSQLEAMRALALIGDQRSIPFLFEALDSDSMLMEYWANQGLERMGVGMVFFNP